MATIKFGVWWDSHQHYNFYTFHPTLGGVLESNERKNKTKQSKYYANIIQVGTKVMSQRALRLASAIYRAGNEVKVKFDLFLVE